MSNDSAGSAGAATPFFDVCDLHKAFGSNRVLRGVDLRVPRGEVVTVLGGSGSGKSVLLKHLVGLLRADAGEIRIEGRDVTRLRESEWIEERKHVGYVFQGAALFDSLSVYENIAYPLREHLDLDEEQVARRVAECLEAVGLPGIEARMPAQLSGGMRKRVGVARAIALEPRAILYDEPTTGLDPGNSRRVGRMIRDLQRRLDVTSVVVTHDTALCLAVSDRVALLRGGRVVEAGSAERLRGGGLPRIRAFLEGEEDEEDGDATTAPSGASPRDAGGVRP